MKLKFYLIDFVIVLLVLNPLCFIFILNFFYNGGHIGTNYNSLNLNSNEISIITPENKTYTKPMSGYYPATIGFENESIGDSPHGWTEFSEVDRTTSIVAAYNGHKNVFKIYDNAFSASLTTVNRFSPKTHGTIEYWLLTSDVTMACSNIVYEGPDWGLVFTIRDGYFKYRDSSTYHIISGAPVPKSNQWYHIRIEFRCNGAPTFQNLNENRFFAYIDGIQYGEFPFVTDVSQVNGSAISLGYDSALTSYLDAVGYSWDPNYKIGDNMHQGLLLSFENSTSFEWIRYSLDKQTNKTIVGNMTIPLPFNGVHSIQLFGTDTLGVDYESDIRYFSIEIIDLRIITPENKIYTEPMKGYYPSSYGFEKDQIGDNPTNWIVSEPSGATINIISEMDGHNNVIELNDPVVSGWVETFHNDSFPRTHGTIELWLRFNTTSDWVGLGSRDTLNNHVLLRVSVEDNKWRYRNSAGTLLIVPNVADPVANKWTHIRIDFRCHNAPSYLGLSNDRYSVTIDGINSGELEHWGAGNLDYKFLIVQSDPATISKVWVDAVGFSWDPDYDIGDNLNEGLLLSYSTTGTLNWTGYSLDNLANVTIYGNTTIPMPPNGLHRIQIFAINPNNHVYSSELKYFEVDLEDTYIPPNNGDDEFFIINLIIITSIVIGLAVIIFAFIVKSMHMAKIKKERIIPSSKLVEDRRDSEKQKKEIVIERIRLVNCPFCQMEIYSNQNFCNYCGGDIRGIFD